jgi:F-type H+-transporting ATPase subunit a
LLIAMAENGGHADPFDPGHLIGHVKDADYFEVPRALGGKWTVPQLRHDHEPIATVTTGFQPVDDLFEPLDLKITKFMVLEVVAAILVSFVFIWLAQKIASGQRPRGRLWNLFEIMLLFIRDEVARPAIGKHDADRFLPYLWTMFFFILTCNLLGMVPWAGSPTGALATTGALAICTFATVVGGGMMKLGPVGFWKAQVPHMELPPLLAIFLLPMIFAIEVLGLLIKHFVLAMRLLANMMAGHLVLAVLITFVLAIAHYGIVATLGVGFVSVLGATALSLLELLSRSCKRTSLRSCRLCLSAWRCIRTSAACLKFVPC